MPSWLFRVYAVMVLALGAGACLLSLRLSRHGFSGYDVSPMIDSGWRVFRGEIPGKDFVVTFPASLYLLTAACFRVFGVTWHGLAKGACCVYLLLLALGLLLGFLLQRVRDTYVALWVTSAYVVGQTIPLLSINHLWHASLAQSFGLYAVFATFVVLSAIDRTGDRSASGQSVWVRRFALGHLLLASAALLLCKPNTAYPALLLCFVVLFRARANGRTLGLTALAAASLATAALALVRVTPWSLLSAYLGLTGRLVPKAFFNGILFSLYARYGLANLLVYAVLAPAVWLAVAQAWRSPKPFRDDVITQLGTGALLVGLLGMGTNFDFKLTDTPLVLMGLALLSLQTTSGRVLRFRTCAAGLALLLLALYFGVTRFRMQIVGDWADDKCGPPVHFEDVFLGSFNACAAVPAALAEVDQTLASTHAHRVFFGPSLEFFYAARRLPAPEGLPDWWDPGTSFPLRKTDQISDAWERNHFDLLVFSKFEDVGQMTPRIIEDLRTKYVLVPGNEQIHVYRPR